MQGSEEKRLAAQKAALLAWRKKILKFPNKLIDKAIGNSFQKKIFKNEINSLKKVKPIGNVFKKNSFNDKLPAFLSKKENLVFLITFKEKVKCNSAQKFLLEGGIKVRRSCRVHWASNAPRYLVTTRKD